MLAKTHILSSFAVASPFISYLPQNNELYILISIAIGSVFPDIDEERSFLSRRIYFVSAFISLFTKHRGVTHTLLFLLALLVSIYFGFIASKESGNNILLLYGFAFGYIMHILGDMATKEGGIAIFYPIQKKRYFILPEHLRFQTSGNIERYIISPAFAIIFFAAVYKSGIFAQYLNFQ